jgi:alpha-tubulin suppressor-like RCC1 family protein
MSYRKSWSRSIGLLVALLVVLAVPALPAYAGPPTPGTVLAWGSNRSGELGDGTSGPGSFRANSAPVWLAGGPFGDVVAVAGGGQHSLALRSDGTVWVWGSNVVGQLGDGAFSDVSTPVRVPGLDQVIAISAPPAGGPYSLDGAHSVALRADGTVWAWGRNSRGQLGDGTTGDPAGFCYCRRSPVQVLGPSGVGYLTGIVAIAAGGAHTLALHKNGTVWAWGSNNGGQLGDGTNGDATGVEPCYCRLTPVQVTYGVLKGLVGIRAISAGWTHSLALAEAGTVMAWGSNRSGELGGLTPGLCPDPFAPFPCSMRAIPVTGLGGVTAIAAGGSHSLARRSDGTVWGWGQNIYGQLGDGTTTDRTSPAQVVGPGGAFLTEIAAVAGGAFHSIAARDGGKTFAWGQNGYGQLGDGTTTNRHVPATVLDPAGSGPLVRAVAIAGGGAHSLAVVP